MIWLLAYLVLRTPAVHARPIELEQVSQLIKQHQK